MIMKHPSDIWFNIYWGIASKRTGISKRNLIQMENCKLGNILPEESWLTLDSIENVNSILSRSKP